MRKSSTTTAFAGSYPPTVPNAEPLFCDTNQRGISIGLRISDPSQPVDLVGEAFIKQWKRLQTGGIKSEGEAIYRLTEDIKRIFEFQQLQIHASADDKTLRLLVNGRQYGLLEMGSGLSQFILVLANAAIRRPSYILIDEPELNLHASLQTDFLETLASYSSEGVVFATHSLGLARTACRPSLRSMRA